MLTTTEIRWFYSGTLPAEIQDWFNTDVLGEHHHPPEEREDVYLHIPECEYLGIKLRQKRLEIKLRKAELDALRFGDNLEGKAEKWVKWSCEDPTAESLIPVDLVKKAPWLTVKKVRCQRKYQVSYNTSLISVPVDRAIDRGCNVEITQLNIHDNAWWSLAFEAYGEDTNLIDNLKAVASWILKSYPIFKLQTQDSYAYPKWLAISQPEI